MSKSDIDIHHSAKFLFISQKSLNFLFSGIILKSLIRIMFSNVVQKNYKHCLNETKNLSHKLSLGQMQNKLNTCRNLKLQYTKRGSLEDHTQHYLFHGFYLIKQIFWSARIAKLAETFNYWSQIKLHVTNSVRVLLDTKV